MVSERIEFEAGAGVEILERGAPVLEIRHFRREQRQLFRHLDAFDADLAAHLAHRVFDRHARFGADQHQVERVGIGALDRLLALRGGVAQIDLRRLDAEVDRRHHAAELDRQRLLPIGDDEDVDRREDREADRGDEPAGDEGVFGPGAAEAGFGQRLLGRFGAQPARQVERVDQPLEHRARARPQLGPVVLGGEAFALAQADALALVGDRPDAARQIVGLQHRHDDGQRRRRAAERGEQERHEVRVAELGEDQIEHRLSPPRSRS